ncbi:MAG: hypothetical protein H0T11_09525 [Chthoniobacterales bacterium]|nr:hypothetical protein [Chthoniobacterales bacterium]
MNNLLRGLIVSTALAAPSYAWAQEPAAPSKPIAVPEVTAVLEEDDGPNEGALSFAGGLDWTTAYFFRGYNQEDSGLILQPYATMYAAIVDEEDFGVTAYVGIWNSFHSKKTGAGSSPNSWYESDLFGGVDVGVGPFTIGGIYTYYTYPNDAFETIQEIGGKITFDDSTLWGEDAPITFNPYVAAYVETSDGNGTEDTYGEVGIAPGFDIGDTGATLTVPVALGLSIDDYYVDPGDGDNEVLGYVSVGATASVPLPLPADYGSWSFIAGIQYIHLFADGLEAVNDGGEDYELLGKVGVSFSY